MEIITHKKALAKTCKLLELKPNQITVMKVSQGIFKLWKCSWKS
jgi:hypothetical protein